MSSVLSNDYMLTSGNPDPLAGDEVRRLVVQSGQLTSWDAIRSFVYAGNATFTLRSGDERYTYRVRKPKDDGDTQRVTKYGQSWFVSLLRGPSNEDDYAYMGVIDKTGFHRTKNSRMGPEARSWRWFERFMMRMTHGGDMPVSLEVWHEGKCGRCGRKLTVPESIERGIGPECAGRME